MTNALFGFQNHAATGTLTASAAAAGLGADQLANPHGATSTSWQTPTGTTSAWVQLDAGATVEWGAFALCNTSLTQAATVRWRLSHDATFSGTPIFDTGAVPAVAAGYRQAVAVEPAALQSAASPNVFPNVRLAGGTPGAPGTPPTSTQQWSTVSGVTVQYVENLSSGGMNGVRYRISGTAAAGGSLNWNMAPNNLGYPASSGQNWTGSIFAAMSAGSLTNISNLRFINSIRQGGGTLAQNSISMNATISASLTRYSVSSLNLGGTATGVMPNISVTVTAGAVDITLDVFFPQLEQGTVATAPLLTPALARYLRVDIADPANPTGVLRAAQLYAGPVSRPRRNIGFDSAFAREAEAPALVTRGGQHFPTFRYARRSWRVALSSIDARDVWTLTQALQIAAQDGSNVLFIPFPTGADVAREAVFGIVSGASGVGWPSKSPAMRAWSATITERL